MPLFINNYREPGTYDTVIPNPTTATAAGPPIVAVLGPALRGSYDPLLYTNPTDVASMYGQPSKNNPLPLGAQIAFENGAPQVLCLNVEPQNSVPSSFTQPLSSFTVMVSGVASAVSYPVMNSAILDPVTQQPLNTNGTLAGAFYVQDFNFQVPDPVLNANSSTAANFYANAQYNLYQYFHNLLGGMVPIFNTQMAQVLVTAPKPGQPPAFTAAGAVGSAVPGMTQSAWNVINNALAVVNGINSTYNCPIQAQILVPDSAATAISATTPMVGYRDVNDCVNRTIHPPAAAAFTPQSIYDVYAYAMMYNGFTYVSSLQAGSQHDVVLGLFPVDTNNNPITLSLPVVNGTNPYIIVNNGADGVVTNQSYINALNNQLTTVRADIIVVLNTDVSLQQLIKTHVEVMSSHDERNERIAIVSGPINELYTTSIANAQALQGGDGAQRMVYVWPTGGYRYDPYLNTTITLDGSYLAAACGGILASNDAATPLTWQTISGFTDVIAKTTRTSMNSIAQNGVTIIENNPTAGLRVRDGLTCDPTSPETQEISVVRQIDFAAQSVRDLLDGKFVAKKISLGTLPAIVSAVQLELSNLVTAGIIYGAKQVTARINPYDSRQIDVNFYVRPAYPCKYVEVTIAVTSDLSGF